MKKAVFLVLCAILLFAFASCGEQEFVLKYDGRIMTKPEYSYWFSTIKTQMVSAYNNGIDSDEFWATELEDGLTYKDVLTDSVHTQISSILVSCALFDEYGLELDDDTVASIDADILDKEDYIGDRIEMNAELARLGLNVDVLREVYINAAKVSAVREYLYGSNGTEAPGDDDIEAYFAENYRAAKLIVIYSGIEIVTDDDGNYVYDEEGNVETVELNEEQKAIKAELVTAVKEALDAGADIDECIAEFSEIDYSEYPNGFFISESDSASYGSDVVDALWSMDVGGNAIVSDDVMTFIVYRDVLPEYKNLNATEKTLVSDMEDLLINQLINEKFRPLIEKIEENEELLSDFDIRTAHMNSYY
ncbi:MAG: hypothetical protein IJD17_03505 [Clostridia bacterium]|nr:hypothetical protein [Clostridia bacterium]